MSRWALPWVLCLFLVGCGSDGQPEKAGPAPGSVAEVPPACPAEPPPLPESFASAEEPLLTATTGPEDDKYQAGRPSTIESVLRTQDCTVDLTLTGGVCGEARWIEVAETAREVVLTAKFADLKDYGTTEDGVMIACPAMGVTVPARVTLAAPLGDRALIDGACAPADDAEEICHRVRRGPGS